MTFEQLRYFCAAAQLGSFSKAAESIPISQPSLCVAIRKLEREYGVKLFQPNRKGAVLTEAGRIFWQDAQNLLAQADLTKAHMRQFAQRDWAEIRIAYTYSMADAYIPRLLKQFQEQEGKGCIIYSDEMPSDQIAQGLREGRFDFGLGSQIPPDPEIEQIPIAYQKLCLLTPADDFCTYQDRADFAAAPLICYRQDYPMYRTLSGLLLPGASPLRSPTTATVRGRLPVWWSRDWASASWPKSKGWKPTASAFSIPHGSPAAAPSI